MAHKEMDRIQKEFEWIEKNKEVLGEQYDILHDLLVKASERYRHGPYGYFLGDYDAQWYRAVELIPEVRPAACDHIDDIGPQSIEGIPNKEKTLSNLRRAQQMVSDLCKGKREWVMSISARPDVDPDIVIGTALRDAITYIEQGDD